METKRNTKKKSLEMKKKQMLLQKEAAIPLSKALVGKEKTYKATSGVFGPLT